MCQWCPLHRKCSQEKPSRLFKNYWRMSRDLAVEIFAAGDGINYPRPGNTVTVHYTGFLPDGRRFDSSRDRGKPFKFRIGAEQVIPGLDRGVAQLSIGERAKLTIPFHLAYGDKGFPGLIPPRSDLTFDIELITFSWNSQHPAPSIVIFRRCYIFSYHTYNHLQYDILTVEN